MTTDYFQNCLRRQFVCKGVCTLKCTEKHFCLLPPTISSLSLSAIQNIKEGLHMPLLNVFYNTSFKNHLSFNTPFPSMLTPLWIPPNTLQSEPWSCHTKRDGRSLTRVLTHPFLAWTAHDGVLCTFSYRKSATAISNSSWIATPSLQLSSSRQGKRYGPSGNGAWPHGLSITKQISPG